jgi:hypothetical protein
MADFIPENKWTWRRIVVLFCNLVMPAMIVLCVLKQAPYQVGVTLSICLTIINCFYILGAEMGHLIRLVKGVATGIAEAKDVIDG